MRDKTSLIMLLAVLVLGLPVTAAADPADDYAIRFTKSMSTGDLPAAHLAKNPAQGFDAWIAADGVRIEPHDGDWQVRLELLRVGREGAMRQVESAGVESKGSRAELHRGGDRQPGSLVEWYVNDEQGLEQGFTLQEAPVSPDYDSPLVLELALDGNLLPLLVADGQRVNFLRPGDSLPILVYGPLSVVDNEGHELPAQIELAPGPMTGKERLRIVFSDVGASYPVMVDPLITSAAWSSPYSDATFSVAWGDCDADGDLDLAIGNYGQPDRVYENTNGDLVPVWVSAASGSTRSVAWGDWDSDGDLDLAAGNDNQPNRVYENTNGCTLTSAWMSSDFLATYSVAWGDWDGDGDLDLAAGNHTGPNGVYENTGGDLSLAWISADSAATYSVAWGDWDGDGDLDLAAGNFFDPNRVYENTGGNLASVWVSSESELTLSVAWGDWDGDGDLDLAAGNDDQPNRVYENIGGTFTPSWTSPDSDNTWSVAWGDWDGDGDLELAAGNNGQPNRVYDNTDGGLSVAWSSSDHDNTTSVAWGDWDGDGDLDLTAGNWSQPNRVYENTGHALTSAWTYDDSDYNISSVAWGDWDSDGDLDLAAARWGQNRVYENTGGDFTVAWISVEADNTSSVAWGDWDGDGDLDLAAGNSWYSRVYENTGGDLVLVWSSLDIQYTSSVAWGDWDGDGDLDLAFGNAGQQPNRVYENTGTGLVPAWASVDTDPTVSVAWGDWDGDGDLDLAAGNLRTPNRVYENLTGDLASEWISAETDWTVSVAWGDWDGDGDLDLAAANYDGDPNRVYENLGGDLSLAWTSPELDYSYSLAWGDWEGDGDLDLAIGNVPRSRVYENLGGDLSLAWTSPYSEHSKSVAWGDWDGDGDADLVAGGDYQHQPTVRIYENGVLNRPGRLPETPTSPVISKRPGTTYAAFFHSTEQLLRSPIVIDYTLVDEESDPARRIIPQYSLTGGGSWHSATEFFSDGTVDLPASPQGEPHYFMWDATADGVLRADNVVFRITVPYQASTRLAGPIQRAALSATSPPFRVGDPVADLAVTKTDGKETVEPGEDVTYTITVINSGPEDVTGATVTDTFPPELTGVSWTCSEAGGGTCANASGSGDVAETVTLPAATSVVFTATGTVDPAAAGMISNTVTATLPAGMAEIDPSDNTATDTDWVEPDPVSVETLILAHPGRMGLTPEQVTSLMADLWNLARQPRVVGKVVDLGDYPALTTLYSAWDDDSASPEKANEVLFGAGGIHDVILDLKTTYTGALYLILVGGDQVIPFARLTDQTHEDFKESAYTDPANDLWGLSATGTTVGQALAAGKYLSDDPLASLDPELIPADLAMTRQKPILPDLAVGRLVESVGDVTAVIDAFIAQEGVLDITTLDQTSGHKVLVSGYHFQLDVGKANRALWKHAFDDSAQSPHRAPVNDWLVGDYWDEDDLLGELCGSNSPPTGPYKISNLNGHATHWELGVPGYGPDVDFHGLLSSSLVEPTVCDGQPLGLSGNVVYTADCHGGLPVPNTEPDGETLDLSEALASLGVSAYLANSGFGWGMKCAVGYSEMLVRMFTEELIGKGTTTVGEAVNAAKLRYSTETTRLDQYDLKTSHQWRLTGIPNLELRVGPGTAAASPPGEESGESTGGVTVERRVTSSMAGYGPEVDPTIPPELISIDLRFNLTGDDVYTKYNTSGDEITGSCEDSLDPPDPDDRLACRGCYYTLADLDQRERATGEADLPVQPYLVHRSRLDGTVMQDVLWKGAAYEQEEGWVPIFGTLASEGVVEPDRTSLPRRIYINNQGPAMPPRRGGCGPSDPEDEIIVLTTADIEDDNPSDPTYSLLNLHRIIDLEVFYSLETQTEPCDQIGPAFGTAPFDGDYHRTEGNWVHWQVPATDPAGVWRLLVVYDDGTPDAAGRGQWLPFELTDDGTGTWRGSLQVLGSSRVTYFLQAIDNRGNVSWLTYHAGTQPSGIPLDLPLMVDVPMPGEVPDAMLSVPDPVDAAEAETVGVPVNLTSTGRVAAVSFSLDYDETCLDPDVDDDGELDHYTSNVPADFTVTVLFNALDTDGEIDVSIFDVTTPSAILPDGELLNVTFAAICQVTPPIPVDAAVAFSFDPVATFGDEDGQDLSGGTTGGVVRVWPGPRGDCNSSDAVGAPDLTAIALEIFDGDGEHWFDAANPTFIGSPAGCDANASTKINAADVPCTNLLIFGLECGGGGRASAPSAEPWIVVTGTAPGTPGEPGWIHVRLEPNGAEVGSVALSLDLDPAVFNPDEIDADSDGVPDLLVFPGGEPGLAVVSFDAADSDGELDLLVADLTMTPLAEGVLLELGVPVDGTWEPPAGLSVSSDPPPSFGSVTGVDVGGQVYVGETGIFSDGFESGDTTAWLSMPN